MAEGRTASIRVPLLARVEGEGALEMEIREGRLEELRLRIFEPPRLFEKFLEGRSWHEVPDLVARICGICPVAYQMSAVHALEGIFGIDPGPWVRAMRRLMYCGEWIESHCLHMMLLAAPDFLGYGSVIEMAREHPLEVRRGLALQALGNDLIRLLGARSVHPVGVRVGGFYKAPTMEAVESLRERLRTALPEAQALIIWAASLPVPDAEQQFPCVAMRHPAEYPMNEGRIVSDHGLDIAIDQVDKLFTERQVPYSTALFSELDGKPYLVGPLARINLNQDCLPRIVTEALGATTVRFPSHNLFHSVVARAAEVCYAIWEALRILDAYVLPDAPYVDVVPRAGIGYGCTEAPRGMLWHRYETGDDGTMRTVRIVPPTSQNQGRIEDDLKQTLERFGLHRSDAELRHMGERVIRNYDPCISCSTHFLKLKVRRV
ncbi:MAG TPA: nickel-dependent hydrogenase large subunit [Noviherbaspirillum sp.]|uniref:Ni/Fe hydrogenase subunit alpha n=1 Tax=Noviherbaspirillum sp. TaxID=1926288 RepID=UPI002B4A1432|nr:nickel-dependent hydrogenase large subunit [Noviherbaspirillum sp.]HJV88572.1 nickel-dependent hydrogenase large subunit [Noviherbaspirillum sp.]